MSRAMVVLDTEFQRRRAADWCWAAKNGSRVEFKGPKRSLDQNSLMWVLLTEVAVHMRKTAGLDYSTEEWKHVFLHGWGREVRFLPALDGKGVVPIPQSSSDLSKEEMTDFLEFILKEGAERGVQFDDHSSSAAPQADDEGSGEDSPCPPAADLSARAAEPDAGGHEAEDDLPAEAPASGVRPASEADKRECLGKFLALATDDLPLDDRRKNIEFAKDCWKRDMPTEADFVKACMTMADKVAKSELPMAKARQYLESLI